MLEKKECRLCQGLAGFGYSYSIHPNQTIQITLRMCTVRRGARVVAECAAMSMSTPPRSLREGRRVAVVVAARTRRAGDVSESARRLTRFACLVLLAVGSSGADDCYCDRRGSGGMGDGTLRALPAFPTARRILPLSPPPRSMLPLDFRHPCGVELSPRASRSA